MATVVLLGTLDTKAAELAYLSERVLQAGCDVVLVDAGVHGDSRGADVPADEVAAAAGVDRAALARAGDQGAAVSAMTRGAEVVARRLYDEGRLDGILGVGGSGGTALVSAAMRALPYGVPKLLVSTMASGDTRPYVGTSDMALLHSVVDFSGVNRVSERILANAAAAIAGMARESSTFRATAAARPLVAATMFGNTMPCVTSAKEVLERRGYEVMVFHATGTGGRSMEGLIRDGLADAVLDVTTTELADELVGGVLSAGPDRLTAAAEVGLPQVVSLGALDMVNFGPIDSVPERFRDRTLVRHNTAVTLMRTTATECAELGRMLAGKLNAAGGPLAVFIPAGGLSMLGAPGGPFHDPGADAALFTALRDALDPRVEVVELATDINDPAFGRAMAERLDGLYRAWHRAHGRPRPEEVDDGHR